jgi:hypothetical protein
LKIDSCKLETEGAKEIINALAMHPSISLFSIEKNKLNDKLGTVILNMLKENKSLTKISFAINSINDALIGIGKELDNNATLTSLNLR